MTEELIKLTAKLYRCRDSMKGLFGDEYETKIKWYKDILNGHSQKNGLDILESLLKICNDPVVVGNGMASVLFMAAAVEILEPSPTPPDQ